MQQIAASVPPDSDIIHVQHEYGLYQYHESSLYGVLRQYKKPIVTTMHAVGNFDVDGYIYENSDKIIVHNEHCWKQMARNLPDESKMMIIPHGVNVRKPMPKDEAKKALGIGLDKKIVGYCGFISNYKGLETLIDAVAEIPDPNVLLVIAGGWHTEGSTNYINQLREYGSKKLGERVTWLGYIKDEKLPLVYGCFDVVVYPSKYASESGALLMAIGFGKTVFASDLPPFREKEKQEALFTFHAILKGDLTDKLKHALDNPKIIGLQEYKAMSYAVKNSWNEIGKWHVATYTYKTNLGPEPSP